MRFCVAGMEAVVRAPGGELGALAGSYHRYPSRGGAPALDLEVERVPGFAAGRARGPEYPGFRRWRRDAHTIRLERFDAEGDLELPSGPEAPLRGRFRVGDSANSLEAIIRIGASITLPRLGALIVHASVVEAAGAAQLFAGVSGAGKSTIARILVAADPARRKISDELTILRPAGDGWEALVAPFIGSEDLEHGRRAPLAALNFLVQAPIHERMAMSRTEVVRELLRHVLTYAAEAETANHVLAAASQLAGAVPGYRLRFAPDAGVAQVLGIA